MSTQRIPLGTKVRLTTANAPAHPVEVWTHSEYVPSYGCAFKWEPDATHTYWVEGERIISVDSLTPVAPPTVWVVSGHIHWEGSDLLAVCATEEIAKRVADERRNRYDLIDIESHEIVSE